MGTFSQIGCPLVSIMQPGTKCSILHMNHSAHTKVQGPKHIGSRDLRGELQNHFFSSKSEIAHQCAGAIARGQNRRPIGSWGGQPKGPHGDFHTAQSTEPQLGSATQIIIVSRALGYHGKRVTSLFCNPSPSKMANGCGHPCKH